MKYVEGAVKTLLDQDNTLISLLDSSGVMATNKIPEGAELPSVLIEQTSWTQTHTKDGPSGPDTYRFSISSWSEDLIEAKNIMAQVKDVLNGYDSTINGFRLYIKKDSQDARREDQIGPEGIEGEAHDYIVIHRF